MSVTKRLTIETVNLDDDREMDGLVDQMFTAGLALVKPKATNCGGKASSIHKAIS